MITEFILVGAVARTCKYLNSDKYKFKKKLESICKNNSRLSNKSEKTLKLVRYERIQDGHRAVIEIPDGLSAEDIKGLENVFKTNLNVQQINFNFNFANGLLEADIIKQPLHDF